jgi:hypothetical protein|tara:strand:- start:664 stop:777 length:114 start_codon:yes stop_codon:yes gene_type:complete
MKDLAEEIIFEVNKTTNDYDAIEAVVKILNKFKINNK